MQSEQHKHVLEKGGSSTLIFSLSLIFIAGITWYMRFKWQRRRFCQLLSKIKMPPRNYPIVGHIWILFGTPTTVFSTLVHLFFKYGPNFIVWFVHVPTVVIGKPEDLEIIMQSQCCVGKSFFYEFTKDAVGDGLFSAPVHKWRRTRKIIQPTFNSKILNTFVPIFAATSSICVNEILPKYVNKKDVDWYEIFTSTNLDTISQTAMGVDTDAQRKEMPFGKHLDRTMRVVFTRMTNVHLFPNIIFNLTKLSRDLREALHYMKTFTQEVLEEKKIKFQKELEENPCLVTDDDAPIKRKAFLELLLELDHKGNKFTDEELKEEVMTFFVGGTDTSAVISCFFLSMMGMHQDIQQKVYEEIIDVLGPDKIPDVQDLPKLDLLERCLKETMRLFTPAPFISRLVQEKEVELTDFTLPVGTVLILSLFYVHRCSDYWEDPLKFDPDRFLPEAVAKRHPFAYLPFSGGLRGCVGMRYSFMNLKNLQSMILRRFKVYCDYNSVEDIKVTNRIVIRPVDGFKFYLEERK